MRIEIIFGFLLKWLINILALFVVVHVVSGVSTIFNFLLSPGANIRISTFRSGKGTCRTIEKDDVIDVECT